MLLEVVDAVGVDLDELLDKERTGVVLVGLFQTDEMEEEGRGELGALLLVDDGGLIWLQEMGWKHRWVG